MRIVAFLYCDAN